MQSYQTKGIAERYLAVNPIKSELFPLIIELSIEVPMKIKKTSAKVRAINEPATRTKNPVF